MSGFESLFQAEKGQPVGQRESQSTNSDGNQCARRQVASQRSYQVGHEDSDEERAGKQLSKSSVGCQALDVGPRQVTCLGRRGPPSGGWSPSHMVDACGISVLSLCAYRRVSENPTHHLQYQPVSASRPCRSSAYLGALIPPRSLGGALGESSFSFFYAYRAGMLARQDLAAPLSNTKTASHQPSRSVSPVEYQNAT